MLEFYLFSFIFLLIAEVVRLVGGSVPFGVRSAVVHR